MDKKLSKSARRRRNQKSREKDGAPAAEEGKVEIDFSEITENQIQEIDETPRARDVVAEASRANSFYEKGELQEAVDLYTSLLNELGNDYPRKQLAILHYNRGNALLKLAGSNFEDVLKINPEHDKAKLKLNQIRSV